MNYAIIVAGGKGSRFGGDLPKQFINLENKAVLMHSIEAFYSYNNAMQIIVALPNHQIEFWKELCKQYNFTIKHSIVEGGESRFHSVKNALARVTGNGLVGIHDGVRPLIDKQTITNCYKTAYEKGNAIPVVDLVDSIREIDNSTGIHAMRNRSNYKLVQTPQVFDIELISLAFTQSCSEAFTDDASVLEYYDGSHINLVKGNRQNIKITTTEDLIYAKAILQARQDEYETLNRF